MMVKEDQTKGDRGKCTAEKWDSTKQNEVKIAWR